jgi:hypothetical protein
MLWCNSRFDLDQTWLKPLWDQKRRFETWQALATFSIGRTHHVWLSRELDPMVKSS